MRIATVFSALMFVACGPVSTPIQKNDAATRSANIADAGTVTNNQQPTTNNQLPLTAAASVTRHLPGTAITTATGKYTYLVQSDGTVSPFASAALAAASGYPAATVVTVSAAELYCYGHGDQISVALPPPPTGKLRDGTLVKEKNKTDTYAVSDGVAWPIINGNVFVEAGYAWENILEIAAGSLARAVDAVGDCVAGIACLDEAYLLTCSQDAMSGEAPTSTATSVATSTASVSTASATATSASAGTSTTASTTVNQRSAINVTRHLPGTAITTATGKYVYLVQDNGTAAPFASAALATASGYDPTMVITVSAAELYCYGRSDQITTALPAPASGKLRDGALVKEKGKTDIYAVSEGVAWPIESGAVFVEAGYDWNNIVEIAIGTLANKVDDVGDCLVGLFCLDEAYLLTCSQDAINSEAPTSTATSVATSVATSSPIATASATSVATQSPAATATNTQTAVITPPTSVATSVATTTPSSTATAMATATSATSTSTITAAATATQAPVATATVATAATNTQTATATTVATQAPITTAVELSSTATTVTTAASTGTMTASATATVTSNQQPSTIDLSWVYTAVGAKLCLNAAYFDGGNKAILLIWSGPDADTAKGSVATQTNDRFCWDFANKGKGLYYFWADVPDPSCSSDICPRDAVSGNGAMYMTAPKATPAARHWLHCESTGCDGAAYWDGSAFTPMGD